MPLDLFDNTAAMTPETLSAYLNAGASRGVDVAVTQNRVSMVSARFPVHGGHVRLRVHESFLAAPLEVRVALKQYVRTRHRDAWRVVADYAKRIPDRAPGAASSRARSTRLETRGEVYNLKALFDSVNAEFFSGQIKCRIGWGRDRTTRRRLRRSKSIRYGSWSASTRTIRIHPRLDDARVPAEFVRYIVFHEMLHVVVPSETLGGRRYHHPPNYRKLEKQFPDMPRMRALSRALLDVII